MVRTRGLGRALARVIGRGRQDEHDAVDVARRCRPTASARRQQVHIVVDEGVPQVIEDVPQMTEDVPHMADDVPQTSKNAPQMTSDVEATVVEDLGRDGAEGSHADEGFPGVSHGRKVALIGRLVPETEGLVTTIRLSPLIGCSGVTSDPGLISVFVERCHRETNTFHLLVGELMITLDDVLSLLHLPISGAFHSFKALSMDEAVFLLMELLKCWIYEHFPSVHQCVTNDAYEETPPCASRWLTTKAHMKGIIGASYRARCDALTVTDMCWLPYSDHRGFGYILSIPLPPVSASLSYDDIDDMWMHFSDHVVAVGNLCVVPGQVSADYMEWFFQISHQFMIPTQAGYEAIAKRLECVLNLRMVTAGTELHDIMQDCLRIVRGGASANGSVRDRQGWHTEH
ncbi:Protein MAIN-LIKE 2 [Glycine soja]